MKRLTNTRAYRANRVNELVAATSDANREALDHFIRAKRNEGASVSYLLTLATALNQLDAATGGTPFDQVEPADLAQALESLTIEKAPSTASTWAARVKLSYRWLNDGELPRPVAKALRRRYKDEWAQTVHITDDEFRALLDAADSSPRREIVARRQALLWGLWDTGFRSSELLALRVKDVSFDGDDGARLSLPPRKETPFDLKTGPRTIYVVESVGALKVWLAFHPAPDAPLAPLFSLQREPRHMHPTEPNKVLKALAEEASTRHVWPHLFRHTRATRAARAGWNEPQMVAYFGWAPGSDMPSRYIHLAQRDMEERVRADASVDKRGGIRERSAEDLIARTVAETVAAVEDRLRRRERRAP